MAAALAEFFEKLFNYFGYTTSSHIASLIKEVFEKVFEA